MEIKKLTNNSNGLGFLFKLARIMPPKPAHFILRTFSAYSMQKHSKALGVDAMLANQWVLNNGQLSKEELEQRVKKTLNNRLAAQYYLYHYLPSPEKWNEMVEITPRTMNLISQSRDNHQGTLLVGPHMGNFDLMGITIAQYTPHLQVISIPNPSYSYQKENEIRQRFGLDITPASFDALREAEKRLRAGKIVVTAIDRPFEDAKYQLNFCGRPAKLPNFYVRLALKANVPIVVINAYQNASGKYVFDTSEPIWMKANQDHDAEIIENAEAVLKVASDFIRAAPLQWYMFFPIWPEAISEVKALQN